VAERGSIEVTHPEVASMWNEEKNAPISIVSITAGSGHVAAWVCDSGHE
jgi:hypothetical protein